MPTSKPDSTPSRSAAIAAPCAMATASLTAATKLFSGLLARGVGVGSRGLLADSRVTGCCCLVTYGLSGCFIGRAASRGRGPGYRITCSLTGCGRRAGGAIWQPFLSPVWACPR